MQAGRRGGCGGIGSGEEEVVGMAASEAARRRVLRVLRWG